MHCVYSQWCGTHRKIWDILRAPVKESDIFSFYIWASAWQNQQNGMCTQQRLISACAYTENTSNNISVTTGWISIKHDRIVPWFKHIYFQNVYIYNTYKNTMIGLERKHKSLFSSFPLVLGRSSTKIAQIILLCCTKWLPELKTEKQNFKWHLLHTHWTDFNQTW